MNWIRIIDIIWNISSRGIIPSMHDIYSVIFKPLVVKNLPRDLHIEITTRCNLSCPFCPRTVSLGKASSHKEITKWEQEISFERFRYILNQFEGLQTLSLHGLGEPLMHPQLLEMIELASSKAIKVRFTTNATLLTPEKSIRLIKSNLRRLIISFDGAEKKTFEMLRKNANFDKVIQNIKSLVKIRNEKAASKLVISVNTVISKENINEVKQMIKLMADIGIDQIILSKMNSPVSSMKEFTLNHKEWNRICQQAQETAGALGIRLFISGRRSETKSPITVHKCTKPWLASMVKLDGGITPCCNIHEPKHEMGNVMKSPLLNIWEGNKYSVFRESIKRKGIVPESCIQCPNFE